MFGTASATALKCSYNSFWDAAAKDGVMIERTSAPRNSAILDIRIVSFVLMQPVPAYTGTLPFVSSITVFKTSSFSWSLRM